ncbi:DUF4136 domain-containing protein [Tamlana sp. 2_MG-2023]|uniref:DUF4136 domain-containing protein n=1 Tax=unclassified Tamlana TaxID=2614803 RepID=UPI0026E1221C|nr:MULTISPECIES: DUF4136 domain-containing protein [unclassified Tamlana]MDO6760405.1 DUF4136 domain-containing protein [Tamlana sp. 2_MG-2023]MDO6789896.1 DUF4136 domain-containing protein [Tamlana sp. 1_MG-2023]
MKNQITLAIIGLCLIFNTSCGPTLKVTTDFDRQINFKEYKTFEVYDLKELEGQLNQLNIERITNAIRTEMIAKGFTESSDNPDLKVNAISIQKNKVAVSANTDFYGYGGFYRPYGYWGAGGGMVSGSTTFNTDDYVDGSLMIDIVSSKTQKLIWQGVGNATIDNNVSNPDEFVSSSIKKILSGFPPEPAAK